MTSYWLARLRAHLHEGTIQDGQQRARLSSFMLKKRWCRSIAGA